jgi:hypothetical protein
MSCMLRRSRLIGCDYKMMRISEIGVPASPYIVQEEGLQVGSEKRVQVGYV